MMSLVSILFAGRFRVLVLQIGISFLGMFVALYRWLIRQIFIYLCYTLSAGTLGSVSFAALLFLSLEKNSSSRVSFCLREFDVVCIVGCCVGPVMVVELVNSSLKMILTCSRFTAGGVLMSIIIQPLMVVVFGMVWSLAFFYSVESALFDFPIAFTNGPVECFLKVSGESTFG